MDREIKYITDNINKLSLREKYDICSIIYFYDDNILKQTNNGVWCLFKKLENELILKIYESIKKINNFILFFLIYI